MQDIFIHKKNKLTKLWKKFNNTELDLELKRQVLHDKIIYKICKDKLILSPVKKCNLVLNLGSGYGSWSHIFTMVNDACCIINMDINNYYPIFCEKCVYLHAAEPIIYFEKIDLKKGSINFSDNVSDFVYQRDMSSVYTFFEWNNILKEIYRILKHDAYLELVEYDFIIKHDNLINNKFSNKINNYLINNFKKNNYIHDINILIEITKKIFNKKINVETYKLHLYKNDIFDDECTDVLTIGYEYLKDDIENLFNSKFEDFIENIKKEWIDNKSYILLYFIYIKK